MHRRLIAFAVADLCVLLGLFAPPVVFAKPHERVTLRLPSDWRRVPLRGVRPGLLAVWLSDAGPINGFHPNINVMRFALDEPIATYVRRGIAMDSRNDPELRLISESRNPQCPSVSFVVARRTRTPQGTALRTMQVSTRTGAAIVVATYTFGGSDAIDQRAVRALEKLCPL